MDIYKDYNESKYLTLISANKDKIDIKDVRKF